MKSYNGRNFDDNKQSLLQWYVINSGRVDNYSSGCVVVVLLIYFFHLDVYFYENLYKIFGDFECLYGFILLHLVIFIFMVIHSVSLLNKIKDLTPSSFNDLKEYVNKNIPNKNIFSGKIIEKKSRKLILLFSLAIHIILLPIIVITWINFINSCNSGGVDHGVNFGLMGLVCYVVVAVRIPFYLIGLFSFNKI